MNFHETHNKAQLMAAIRACPFGEKTRIVHHHGHGVTQYTIGPGKDAVDYEAHLIRLADKVRRIPAHVWR